MRLQDVLSSLVSATKEHSQRLRQDVTASDFSATSITAAVSRAEGALAMLASATRLQKLDVIYCRFAPTDYTRLHSLTKQLIVKASGMSVYYTLIDPTREKFPFTPAPSTPATPVLSSPSHSRPPSPGHDHPLVSAEKGDRLESLDHGTERHSHQRHHFASRVHHHTGIHHRKWGHSPHRHTTSHHTARTHSSLLHSALSRAPRTESAVGVFESLRYLNLEATHMSHPDSGAHVARATQLLSTSCQDLLKSCEHGLQGACDWLASIRDNRFNFWVGGQAKQGFRMDKIKKYEDLRRELSLNLDEFTNEKRFFLCFNRAPQTLMVMAQRLTVLDPYRAMFTYADEMLTEREITPHRHLFDCYVYQHHLMQFATSIQDVVCERITMFTL